MRILRLLSSASLSCGCLVGVYETYAGEVITLVDARDVACQDPSHHEGTSVPNPGTSETPAA